MTRNRSGSLVMLMFLVAACSSAPKKEYVEPGDTQSDDCISQCNVVKVACRDQAREVYEWCTRDYQYKRAEHQRCVAAKGVYCFAPKPCPGLEVRACVAQYDDCFESCGGVIRQQQEMERKGN